MWQLGFVARWCNKLMKQCTNQVYILLHYSVPSHQHKCKSLFLQERCPKHYIWPNASMVLARGKARHISHWYMPIYLDNRYHFCTLAEALPVLQESVHNKWVGSLAVRFLDSDMQRCGFVRSTQHSKRMVSSRKGWHNVGWNMRGLMDNQCQHGIQHAHSEREGCLPNLVNNGRLHDDFRRNIPRWWHKHHPKYMGWYIVRCNIAAWMDIDHQTRNQLQTKIELN